MSIIDIKVPNIGDFKDVEIIEVLVKNGQEISKGDTIITLESDKSSVEVPSDYSGKISNSLVKFHPHSLIKFHPPPDSSALMQKLLVKKSPKFSKP